LFFNYLAVFFVFYNAVGSRPALSVLVGGEKRGTPRVGSSSFWGDDVGAATGLALSIVAGHANGD
jgi:hypothetical protein